MRNLHRPERTATVKAFTEVDVAKKEVKLAQVGWSDHLWLADHFKACEMETVPTVDH